MNERLTSLYRNPFITLSVGGVLGTAVGTTVGYIWANRRAKGAILILAETIDDLQSNQLQMDFTETGVMGIDNVNILRYERPPYTAYERIVQPSQEVLEVFAEEATPSEEMEALIDSDSFVMLPSLPEEDEEDVQESRNIFDGDGDDTWDYELERRNRSADAPYIIHEDEFVGDEMGYDSRSTLTWYEGDEILTDSQDTPIYDPASIVGELRWGHGSNASNVVFVRNEKLKAEYEILRDPSSYEDTVLGGAVAQEYEKADLRHSRTPQRFRDD